MNLKRGPEFIACPTCQRPAQRQGAQDDCDVYRCSNGHVSRTKINEPLPDRTKDVCSLCGGEGSRTLLDPGESSNVSIVTCSGCEGSSWIF